MERNFLCVSVIEQVEEVNVQTKGKINNYHNVVGLPVCRLGRMLLDFGVDCLALAGR